MAEVIGLTASLISIASLGVSLTRALYDFGATTSHAREEIDNISKNVSDYSDVLELLVEQLEHDRPVHSAKAVRLVERLYDRSHRLFRQIRNLIPDGRRLRNQVDFLQRILWNFKKTRVDFLVGQLESLKRTVQLLVQVLCTARQWQAYKVRDNNGRSETEKKEKQKFHRQFMHTENVIVGWQRAEEKLPMLREASQMDDGLLIDEGGLALSDAEGSLPAEQRDSLYKVTGNTLAVIRAAATDPATSESQKRALVLHNTRRWLDQFLEEWTILAKGEEVDGVEDDPAPIVSSTQDVKQGREQEEQSGQHRTRRVIAKGQPRQERSKGSTGRLSSAPQTAGNGRLDSKKATPSLRRSETYPTKPSHIAPDKVSRRASKDKEPIRRSKTIDSDTEAENPLYGEVNFGPHRVRVANAPGVERDFRSNDERSGTRYNARVFWDDEGYRFVKRYSPAGTEGSHQHPAAAEAAEAAANERAIISTLQTHIMYMKRELKHHRGRSKDISLPLSSDLVSVASTLGTIIRDARELEFQGANNPVELRKPIDEAQSLCREVVDLLRLHNGDVRSGIDLERLYVGLRRTT